MKTAIHFLTAGALLGIALLPARAAVRFHALGDLPGGLFDSRGTQVSDDGRIVIGTSYSANSQFELFRWTATGGMKVLPNLPAGVVLETGFASADFTRIASRSAGANTEAVLWTQGVGIQTLGDLPGGLVYSTSSGITTDGKMVVGTSSGTNGNEAFRWTAAAGMQNLGVLSGANWRSDAFGVSADGSVIVGSSNNAAGDNEAFIRDDVNFMRGIGDLAGGIFQSEASAISADGSVVVGIGHSSSGLEAFRWTTALGMVGLGDIPGGSFESFAMDVTADGSTIVGYGTSPTGSQAVLWNSNLQLVILQDLVAAMGLTLSGWKLQVAQGISANGRHITGYGANPDGNREAFLISFLPNPPAIALAGKSKVRAKSNGKFKIRGAATDDAAVVRVEYRIGSKGRWKKARGTDQWLVSAKLKPVASSAKVAIRSVDEDGQTSPLLTAKVHR